MVPTLEDLYGCTHQFFARHWPKDAGHPPGWNEWKELKGPVPGGECQGVYALANGNEVLYVGVGAGRNPGRYAGAGLGARLKRYFGMAPGQAEVLTPERQYLLASPWENVELESIHTCPLPHDYGYLAL